MKLFEMRLVLDNFIGIWELVQEMAWQVTIVILLVMLCRFFIGKVSKQACYILWLVVAVRLLCPIMLPSDFSIFNWIKEPEVIQTTQVTMTQNTTTDAENNAVNTIPVESNTDNAATIDSPITNITQPPATVPNINATTDSNTYSAVDTIIDSNTFIKNNWSFLVWIVGMLLMFGYGVISYYRLSRKLRFATSKDHFVYECSNISSPFVFGIIKPRIYLPYRLTEVERSYILQHEKYHIKRRDYLVKLFAFGLLAVYWFHPLVWVAFYLMSRDMEMSCDEQVLKAMGMDDRKAYSTLLLSFACNKRFPLPSPLSFGENDTKSRIKQILNYKSPTLWGIIVVIVLVIIVVVCCLTDAKQDTNEDAQTESTETHAEITDEEILAFAESLYEVKNPYIGDISANSKMIGLLREYYNITGMAGSELQTYDEPFWITVSFNEKPDDTAMWKLASVFLALTENASEFRWEFVAENDNLYTYYVRTEDVEEVLGYDDLKSYADSAVKIAELLMLLDEKETGVTKPMNEVSYTINKHLSSSLFSHYSDKAGIPWELANQYELRLMEDGVVYRNDDDKALYECIYKDFDNSGEMDFALYIRDLGDGESTLHIYMNDDPLYTLLLPCDCWNMEILSGDVDHDGNTELIYSGFDGGNGGAGGYVKGILKYENHTFTEMELPGDFTEEEREYGESGYHIDVFFGEEENTYEVVCPTLGVSEIIESEYFKYEDGSYFVIPYAGVTAGGNCRGFSKLYVVSENNQEYLMADEYIHGETGINHGLGFVRFIFDWDDTEGWLVKDYEVIPSNTRATDEASYFVEAKKTAKYLPSDYNELIKNWTMPVIDSDGEILFDKNNLLSTYAQLANSHNSTFDFWFARLNEKDEITYVYFSYSGDEYYYLEDCSRLSEKPDNLDKDGHFTGIYTNEVYDVEMYSSGKCYEYFYLTNEENLTHEDIMDAMLSSQYPPQIDFVLIYSKELDEEKLSDYMNATGDFITYGIHINMPENRSWISDPRYKDMGDSVIRGSYYDMLLKVDMVLLAGQREAVFEKARAGLENNLSEWDYETWSARTVDGEYIEIKLYVEQLGATNFNTVVAEWEYEGNTYLIYGDTEESDGSSVAKTACYIVEHFSKKPYLT